MGREQETVRAVVEIAGQGGWTPAPVALAWLRGRPGTIVPIIGASTESRLSDNLACLGTRLDAGAVERVDAVSAVPLGFPHDFLREREITRNAYGDRWQDIEGGRSAAGRTVDGSPY
ncbi:aldo/keto reductase [Streptomyces sp. SM10]|uniref:aldo/keto reductase n=1 Tax=Streptomyces sp. SM10 TaxID=565556 RepID=UPI00215620CC|nr:aldo/keto reductase [Streptomyces sp. SM10]